MIVLNLKTYRQSFERYKELVNIAKQVSLETGVRIIVAVPHTLLTQSAELYTDIYAQHVDANGFGAYTGSMPFELLKYYNVKGTLLNHSEKKIKFDILSNTLNQLKTNSIEHIICVENMDVLKKVSELKPMFVAIEPPELIGTGISVSKARPEVIESAVSLAKQIDTNIEVLCGAGISSKEDVKKSLELGAKGVLLASAYVKSKDPKQFLLDLASSF